MSQSAFGPASRSVPRVEFTGGAGAPTDAAYLVTAAHAGLTAEVVVGTTPGGELGGTWSAPTVDASHAGGTHAAAQAAAEATAAAALAGHAAAGDPHTAYLKESDFAIPDFLVGTATGLTAAEIVVGTSPGGELGGTWAAPTVDATHSGGTHAAATAAAVTTANAYTDVLRTDMGVAIAAIDLAELNDVIETVPTVGNVLTYQQGEEEDTAFWGPQQPNTDHGLMSGLGDSADHPWAALVGHGHVLEDLLGLIRRYKTANQALTVSDTSVEDVTQLVFPVAENEVWFFELVLRMNAANATMDAKLGWSVPAGATMNWGPGGQGANFTQGFMTAGASQTPTGFLGAADTGIFGSAAAADYGLLIFGYVFVGATAGSVQLRAAQGTSDPGVLSVLQHSFIRAWRQEP